MKRSLALILAITSILAAVPALAQESGPLELRVDTVDTDGYPRVSVVVTAPRELVGQNLEPSNFQIVEGDNVRESVVTQLPNDELEVLLLLDTSGSMSDAWRDAQQAALSFVDQMPITTRIAVLGFGSTPQVASEFTTDTDITKQAIESLRPRGETALYDAIGVAVSQFSFEPGIRRSLVLLSDGGDTVSLTSNLDGRQSLGSADLDFYAVELEGSEIDREILAGLAAAADGRVVPAADADALAGIYDRIASDLINQYRISFISESYGSTRLRVLLEAGGIQALTDRTMDLPAAPAVVVDPKPTPTPIAPGSGAYVAPPLRSGETVSVSFLQSQAALSLGLFAAFAATALAAWFLLAPRAHAVQLKKTTKGSASAAPSSSLLGSVAARFSAAADRTVAGSGRQERLSKALERAGIMLRTGEFLVLAGSIVIVAFSAGMLLLNFFLGIGLAAVAAAAVHTWVKRAGEKRKRAFADQLEDSLMLMSGTLRAGYGLMQAVDTVAKEAPAPAGEEFQRLVGEVRLGRDLDEALRALAGRVDNSDFEWVVGAISIQREVGGDLAEVLDTVAATIRDRNQIRRQVQGLSAEGRLSAAVLIPLPIVLAILIGLISPGYMSELYTTLPGQIGIVSGVVLMIIGSIWMSRVVKLEF